MLTSSKHFKPFFCSIRHLADSNPTRFYYLSALTTEVTLMARAGNTKGGSVTVPLTSCLTGLELAVLQLTFFCFYL
jgi:hypothetical protein